MNPGPVILVTPRHLAVSVFAHVMTHTVQPSDPYDQEATTVQPTGKRSCRDVSRPHIRPTTTARKRP